MKKIIQQLNLIQQCRQYNLPLWQCPSFLIILTGFITIIAMVSTYFVAIKFTSPEIVALIVIGVTALLTIINYLIIQGFDKLAEANRLKTEFVSIASHQLRTPLTGIKWAINLMTQKGDNQLTKEQLERLKTIEESNQRMIDLVNDLLNVSRIEQRRLGLKLQEVDLGETLKEIVDEYVVVTNATNTSLSLSLEKDLPKTKADFQGIKLVIHNLIDNAIRYSKPKGKIEVKLIRQKNFLRCEIKDWGVGIPERDKKNIFKKFFRSQNVMKHQTEGTGLGLFIAKAIINASGGNINFKSQEHEGSTFWFELPIKKIRR